MWLERFLIVIPSLSYKQLAYSWGSYTPEWPELMIMVSTFAGMALLYLLFCKFVPVISIWELRVGTHPELRVAESVAEAASAGELV
jgi:molybdopterin-containing oxidoreductase family membrane subunit